MLLLESEGPLEEGHPPVLALESEGPLLLELGLGDPPVLVLVSEGGELLPGHPPVLVLVSTGGVDAAGGVLSDGLSLAGHPPVLAEFSGPLLGLGAGIEGLSPPLPAPLSPPPSCFHPTSQPLPDSTFGWTGKPLQASA